MHNNRPFLQSYYIASNVHKLGINHCHFGQNENHIANVHSFALGLITFAIDVSSMQEIFRVIGEYSLVNSLNNLRRLFVSHRHKSLYWQPINNSGSLWWTKLFFIQKNLISLFTVDQFRKTCDICSNKYIKFDAASFDVQNEFFFSFT